MSTSTILILCTGNSCRSQMAEAMLRTALPASFEIASAGSRPSGHVHPLAVEVMAEVGIDLSGHASKHLNEFLDREIHTVITVCGRMQQVCPVFPGQVRRLSLGVRRSGGSQRFGG